MIIDFTEVPIGGASQDLFELFARDFLVTLGYKIIKEPSRGPDGGADIIVSEENKAGAEFKSLVSCKHKAHSGNSVLDSEELNITDRLKQHCCHGFIGFYSTIASEPLATRIRSIKHSVVYDREKIEMKLLESEKTQQLILRYFPRSYEKYRELIEGRREEKRKHIKSQDASLSELTEEALLKAALTAHVLIELAKIKEEFYEADWEERGSILQKLYRFAEHSNPRITLDILFFLESVASITRGGMTESISSSILSLVITFCGPRYIEKETPVSTEMIEECMRIANGLIYDALIKLNDYEIAMNGLTILKYIYKQSHQKEPSKFKDLVLEVYQRLEYNLERPDRNDLEPAKKLLAIFKSDLASNDLAYPPIDDLFR